MIVFVTAYDPQTNANHAVACRIVSKEDLFLGAESATHAALKGALRLRDEPLLVMTHGKEDRLMAQGHDAAEPALTDVDVDQVVPAGRAVFAHACRAAHKLGRAIAHTGSVFWGYTISVNAPEDSPELLPIFSEVFAFIKASFALPRQNDAADRFFEELSKRCDSANDRLGDLYNQGVFVPFSAHQCLKQLQQDLVVWLPGRDQAFCPPWVRGKKSVDL